MDVQSKALYATHPPGAAGQSEGTFCQWRRCEVGSRKFNGL